MLSERQKSVLYAVIQEYTKTAKPVASKEITRNFDLGVSPATIRSEMQELGDCGLLEQPHTSSGRVPTDRGYRFFVDNLAEEKVLTGHERKLIEEVFECSGEEEFVKGLGRAVSQISGMFTATMVLENEIFYETGFSRLMREPEFRDARIIKMFGDLVDFLDEEVRNLYESLPESTAVRIFIGEENPLISARPYTMILSNWNNPSGFHGFITMIGPKRTNYKKHKALLKEIKYYE